MIRPATAGDVPALCGLMARFDAASGVKADAPGEAFSREAFSAFAGRLIGHRLGLAVILDRGAGPCGMLLAHAGPSPFRATLWADEVAFWIDPADRGGPWAGRMLTEYERWAADLGARVAGLSALDERTAALFRRRGYAPAERKFLKVI